MKIFIHYCFIRVCRLIACLLLLINTFKVYAQRVESGAPFIINFKEQEYNGHAQNWAVSEDFKGNIFVANNNGLIVFDGTHWKSFEIPGGITTSIKVTETGEIFVGGRSEFGFFKADKTSGKLEYKSLLPMVQKQFVNFEEIWFIFKTKKGIYFCSRKYIFRYYNSKIEVIKNPEENLFHKAFLLNDRIIIKVENEGLYEIDGNRAIFITGSQKFKDIKIDFILPYSGNNWIIGTRENGFYCSTFIPALPTNEVQFDFLNFDSDKTLADAKLSCGLLLDNGNYCIGTRTAGIFILNHDGKIIEHIDKTKGLKTVSISSIYQDSNKNIWVALENGIALIEIYSPIRQFNENNDLFGNVQAVAHCFNKLWVATSQGLYWLDEANHKFYPGINAVMNVWKIQSYKIAQQEFLLIASDKGFFTIDKNNQIKIIANDAIYYEICISESNQQFIYLGNDFGVDIYSCSESTGQLELWQQIPFDFPINSIIEVSKNELLVSSKLYTMKLLKLINKDKFETIDLDNPKIDKSNSEFRFLKYKENILIGTANGLFTLNKAHNSITEFNTIQNFWNAEKSITFLVKDNSENIWMAADSLLRKGNTVIRTPGVAFSQNNKLVWSTTLFKKLYDININSIQLDASDNAWFATNSGLFKFMINNREKLVSNLNANIRKVTLNSDSVLYVGFKDPTINYSNNTYNLPYRLNSIKFEFSANQFTDQKQLFYRTKLENYDAQYSEWNFSNVKEYTNLKEGKYIFKVMALNLYGKISTVDTFEFVISPPWYRTIYAYIGYVLLGIISFMTGIRYNTRRLKEKNQLLEGIIVKRTLEIVTQKNKIEEINQELTDSILVAKAIQNSILTGPDKIREGLKNSFVLFKPRDIVSGDFYWYYPIKDRGGAIIKVFIAAADCTGHGVPGAFMSMMGLEKLNQATKELQHLSVDTLLEFLNSEIKSSLSASQNKSEIKDGMEMLICEFDFVNQTVSYAGANRPLWCVNNVGGSYEITEIKPDKHGIAGHTLINQKFTRHELKLNSESTFYLFSDGAVDQFGGERGKKLMTKGFKELLLKIQHLDMQSQYVYIDAFYAKWRGDLFQVDDIIIIGIRI